MEGDANISSLLLQYLEGSLAPSGRALLLEALRDPHRVEECREALQKVMEDESATALTADREGWESRIDAILALDRVGDEPMIIAPIRRLPRWTRAAAAILLLLAGAWLYLLRSHPANPSNPSHPVQDIAPGGNKAILTLGNGQKIILDNAHTGVIAQQGSASIQKVGNDQVAYSGWAGGDKKNISYNTLSTPRGGFYELKLPDGTKVWLNAASSITYPTAFTGRERSVSITGEAYFEISRNAAQPFTVRIPGGHDIQVLGTGFNINAYSDETGNRTTLVTGAVRVGDLTLQPGQQAVDDRHHHIDLVKNADIEQVTAWKNGLFRFQGADIGAVMRQIARWYDVQVDYQGRIPDYPFVGKIPRSVPLSEILKLLQLTDIVQFKVEGRKITVMP